jgi:FtsP/CotA-like multicopper oxidase with cupredoxin domain
MKKKSSDGELPTEIARRQFIRYGATGLSALVRNACCGGGGGSADLLPDPGGDTPPDGQNPDPGPDPAGRVVNLTMTEAFVEMVDGTPVYHWVFAGPDGPKFPGPLVVATSGEPVTFRITNSLDEVHEFRIVAAGPAGGNVDTGPIDPGQVASVTFTPTAGGTYLYLDPRNAPVNRVLGLHGILIVLPAGVAAGTAVNTPYVNPTAAVQQIFDDLGTTPEFPGDPWVPVRPAGTPPVPGLPPDVEPFLYRTRLWLFSEVDPVWNARIAAGRTAESGGGIDPATFYRTFKPDYFLINGKAGAFATHDAKDAIIEGFIGEPFVVRMVAAGLQANSLHTHANHHFVLAVNNQVMENPVQIDTMTVANLEEDKADPSMGGAITNDGGLISFGGSRVDILFPMIRPPDIPGDPAIPLRDLLTNEWRFVLGGVPQSPLKYPVHDHVEPSNTAIGGNYPQGKITDIILLGDVDKVFFPKPV